MIIDNPLTTALQTAGLATGDTVLIHSDVSLARRLSGARRWSDALEYLHDSLRAAIGPTGTILAPAFNYGFCQGKPYDHDETPSEVGMYGDYLRGQPGASRSLHPIYSFAAQGPDAHALCDNVSHSSFGCGSVFERLVERNAKLLFFGCSFERCTLVHHAEQMANLPYRFSKWFTGQITANGQTYTDSYEMFCRYMDRDVESDFMLLAANLWREGRLKYVPVGEGAIQMTTCAAVYQMALSLLSLADGTALLRHKPNPAPSPLYSTKPCPPPATGPTDASPMDVLACLYSLDRALVCDGHDQALTVVGEHLPAELNYQIETYAPTLPVWTWRVPERYVVQEAYLETEDGERIADYAGNPLHLVSYSPSVDKWVTWDELAGHLVSDPDRPDAIPWRFGYYERDWGFCVTEQQRERLSRRRDKLEAA